MNFISSLGAQSFRTFLVYSIFQQMKPPEITVVSWMELNLYSIVPKSLICV